MKKLNNSDIWNFNLLERDNAGRWNIYSETPKVVKDYIDNGGYRTPSRSWPMSYFKPLLTLKFAKYLINNDEVLAEKIGLI